MTERSKAALRGVKFQPYWLDSPEAPEPEPSLEGRCDADLLIVGGGFTGLWSAIIAKERGLAENIVLIDAGKIAFGASGRPGAIVSTSVMHGLHIASEIFPNDLNTLERLGRENLTAFKNTLERYNIDCDMEWSGELTVAVGQEGVPVVREEFKLHEKFEHDVELLNEDEVQSQIHSPLFSGGFWSKQNSGTVHPAKLAWGLKKAALSLGVRIYENTALVSVEDTGPSLIVTTNNGKIHTTRTMLCTNAYASGHKNISRRVAMIRDRIIMTEPLSAEQLGRIGWKNRQGVYDTRTQLNYMRLTKDNRMLFGGRLDYFLANNPDPKTDKTITPYVRLANAFFETFPQLDDVTFSHAWSGPIGLTTRMAVHFQPYYGNKAMYAGGYSGFGVTASRFGAEFGLAKLFNENRPELQLEFANTLPGWIPPEPFRFIGAKITMYALDTADKKGGWRALWLKLVDKMGFPLSWVTSEDSDNKQE